jgi:uncharacterized protein YbjQ (UPF0145 family)
MPERTRRGTLNAWAAGPEFDRIARGDVPSSTEARLEELLGWGGSSSFMTPGELAVSADAGIDPIGQVVGLSVGSILPGYIRTTRPGQGRRRTGVARWRERTGPVRAWTALRQRALARLTRQARILGANAVVGIAAERTEDRLESPDEAGAGGQYAFSGTAVRVRSFGRNAEPVLTLASPQELWAMLRAGLEPAGIAGSFASVATSPSRATVAASLPWRKRTTPNVELEDLTTSVYEARRLAMERLASDARALKADGILGIVIELEDEEHGSLHLTRTVHVLASAVRRTQRAPALDPMPLLELSDGARG